MKHRPARKCACICAAKRLKLAAQDRGRAMVRYRERELMVENQNARGQIRKNALEVHFRPLEGKAIGFHAAVRVLELARHRVERLGEHAELVAARHGRTARKVAARHRLRGLRQIRERLGEKPGLRRRGRHCDEERHEQSECQRDDIDVFQPLARNGELAVVSVRGLHRFGALREERGHAVAQLEKTRLSRPIDRHDDAQRERRPTAASTAL